MTIKSRWFWRSFSILMALMMVLSPVATIAAPAGAQAEPPPPNQPGAPNKIAADTPDPAAQKEPEVTPEAALAKIHPTLRDLAQHPNQAIPAAMAPLSAELQNSVLIEVIAQVTDLRAGKTETDLRSFFVEQKVVPRPALGQEGMQKQILVGPVNPVAIMKLAFQPQVEAILPIVLEKNGQPDNYPIDEPREFIPKGPADWAQLRAQAEQTRAGSLPWDQAKAIGDGGTVQPRPNDWFEVRPEGPHKAEVAWERGFTGLGVTVAVNDDGVDFAHPDLMGTQKVYTSTARPEYEGWPYVFSPFSMLLYYLQEIGAGPYISGGYPSAQYVDTSATPSATACGSGIKCFTYTPMIDFLTPGITHHYIISSTMSQSGVIHVGTHPDRDLRDFVWGELPAVLVTDPNMAGVYDTVYVDLDDDYDFRDEKPLTKADTSSPAAFDATRNNMIAYRDMNGDGLADLSGGMLYYIADGQHPLPVSDWYYGADCTAGGMCAGNGDLIALEGSTFDRAYSHGTQCASNIVGQGVVNSFLPKFRDLPGDGSPNAAVYGMAPDAKVVAVADIYYNFESSKIDAYTFEAIGYDAIDQTGFNFLTFTGGYTDTDPIQVTSNSYGSSDQDNDGWEYDGQYVSQVIRYYAPQTQFLFSTGNGAPAFGTVAPPSPNVGIAVGASTEFDSTGWDTITDTQQIMYNDVTGFSNRGPSARGNNGVDVVAGGAYAAGDEELNYYAISTWGELNGNLSWDSWGGTSRSTPVTVGILALLYQAYKDANSDWPTYDIAKAILQSSATDLNLDTFTQGGGSVNADTGTALANNRYGVYALPTEWVPGDYRGEYFPGFAQITYPGDTWTQTFLVTNPSTQTVTVDLRQDTPTLIDSTTFSYTITPEQFNAKPPDNFYKAPQWIFPITATSAKIAQNNWWDNIEVPQDATLMVVRMRYPFNEYDANGDNLWDNRFRLTVYNWLDVNGDGNVWTDTNGNGQVDFTTTPNIVTIDQAQDIDWANAEVDQWEYGRFDYNRPGGNALELSIHNPLQRMLDGLFIGLQQYDASSVETTHLSFEVDFYKNENVEWLGLSTDQLVVPAGGVATFDATATVPITMPAGAYEAGIKIDVPASGSYSANTDVVPVVLNVAKPFGSQLTFGGNEAYQHDKDLLYNNGAVRGLFDWTWRAESGDWRFFFTDVNNPINGVSNLFSEDFEGAFPPAGWLRVDNAGSGNVWERNDVLGSPNYTTGAGGSGFSADADSDATCNGTPWDTSLVSPPIDLTGAESPVLSFASNFQDFSGYGDAWLEVSINNGYSWDTLYYQTADDAAAVSRTFDLSSYTANTILLRWRYSDNGHGCAWFWSIDNVQVVDLDLAYQTWSKILLREQWQDAAPHTDIDTLILGPTASQLGSGPLDFPEPSYFGPYVLDTKGKSPNTLASAGIWNFNTTSGGPEDWVTAPIQDGLHEFLQHNVLFEGDRFWVPFTKTVGTLNVSPQRLSTVTNVDQGVLGQVVVSATLPLNGIVGSGFIADRQTTSFVDEPLPNDGDPNSIDWTYPFTVTNGYFIDISTSSANINDIDLYLYYWDGSQWIQVAGSAGSSANEHVHIDKPQDGQYMVAIANFSDTAGTFNMDLTVGVAQPGITITGIPAGPIAANQPVTLTVHYDFPFNPQTVYQGELHIGIPEAPDLIVVPFSIIRVATVSKTVDKEVAFPGDELNYTIGLFNTFGPTATFTMTDVIPAGTEFVKVTNATYDAANNRIVYTGPVDSGPQIGLDLQPGLSIDLTVMVTDTVAEGSDITNTANVTVQAGEETFTDSASAATHIGSTEFINSYKTASETVEPGGLIDYEVHVINSGQKLANVSLTDPIPVNTEYYSHDTTPPNQSFTYNPGQNRMEWTGNVAPGEERVFSFQVTAMPTVTMGTTITNVATITWDSESMPVEAQTTVVEPTLFISKSGPATALPGDTIQYTITYANQGTAPALDVVISDTLPVSVTATTTTTWQIGTLPPGITATVNLTATLDLDLVVGDLLTNTVTITSSNAGSHTATFTTLVRPIKFRYYHPFIANGAAPSP